MKYKWILVVLWFPLLAAGADAQRYIIELTGDPVAKHVAAESKRTGKRVALDSDTAKARRQQVHLEQKQIQTKLEAMGVKVIDRTDTVSNTLIVDMPDSLAAKIEAMPGVSRVQKARPVKLNLDHALPIHKVPQAWAAAGGIDNAGRGIKIGMIDSGIDITHPGMQDSTMQPPDGFPRANVDSDKAFTNGKVIVARSYAYLFNATEDDLSARDVAGHGTGTAMAAAGAQNTGPYGTISGVAPKAWLGSYKIFGANGNSGSDAVTKAIDDAVADGMDVLNLSFNNPIAGPLASDMQVAHLNTAIASGIIVVCSAGNDNAWADGYDPNNIGSPATTPLAITVGASFNDRSFYPGSATVGDGAPLGAALGSQDTSTTPLSGPLFDVSTLDQTGEACLPFPTGSLTGTIAFVMRSTGPDACSFETKLNGVGRAGAIGALIYTTPDKPLAGMNPGAATLPAVMIRNSDGVAVKQSLAASPSLAATLNFIPASIPLTLPPGFNEVWFYSSRGPSVDGSIKPELVAVGTQVYTAAETVDPNGELYDASGYVIGVDGTSYSAPLVAGAAALVKGFRPGLTLDQYRSLIINTASPVNSGVQEGGAGILNVQAAISATFAATPTALSFLIGGPNPNLSKTLTISNVGASAESYSLAVAPSDDGATAPALGASTLTIQPGQSATVPVTFAGTGLSPGQYQGNVTIRGSQSGIQERVPYWYGIASNVPQYVTPLFVKGTDDFPDPTDPSYPYRANQTINGAILFRVTDSAGILVSNPQPMVTSTTTGATVLRMDTVQPGTYSVSVRLGPRRGGDNTFRIVAGDLDPFDIVIVGN